MLALRLIIFVFIKYLTQKSLNKEAFGSQPKLFHNALKLFVNACWERDLNRDTRFFHGKQSIATI